MWRRLSSQFLQADTAANCSAYVCAYANAQIGPEGALALADALKVNPVLSSLDMSNTRIGGCHGMQRELS
jgi:hypothetical protein